MKHIDLTGLRFGRLTVLRREGSDPVSQQKLWLCQCDCGKEALRVGNSLKRGKHSSCGCYKGELKRGNSYSLKHGHSAAQSPEYIVWASMIQRCTNPKHISYKNYGGRGVTVCAEWLASFEQFLADMGSRPKGHSIDRIKSDKGYEPSNCRWASEKTQQNNRRNNRVITVNGKEMTVSQFAEITGIPSRTIFNRLAKLDQD